MKTIDYIIPTFDLGEDRRRNLDYSVKQFLEKQTGVDIRVHIIDQDRKKHREFNKQWLCNIGEKRCETDSIVIGDLDIYSKDDNYFEKFFQWVDNFKLRWAFGWTKVIYEGKDGMEPQRVDWPEPGINEGCIVFFEKKLWEEMGGANEWIRELRGPDNDLALRARYLTGTYMGFPHTLYHRWHPISKMKQTAFKKHNRDILKVTRRHPDKILDLLRAQKRGGEQPYCVYKTFYRARTE